MQERRHTQRPRRVIRFLYLEKWYGRRVTIVLAATQWVSLVLTLAATGAVIPAVTGAVILAVTGAVTLAVRGVVMLAVMDAVTVSVSR